MLALSGARLGHGVIHADVLALGIKPAKGLFKLDSAKAGGNLLQVGRRLGKVLVQRMDKRSRAPHEHAAVPVVLASVQKFLGAHGVRLLRKTARSQHAAPGAFASFDVTVTGLGARRLDAHYHHVVAGSSQPYRLLDYLAKFLLLGDDVVGR